MSTSARMMASGKLAARLYRLSVSVFCSSTKNRGELKKRLKCLRPTQGAFSIVEVMR